jgi:hypothetical protein
MADSFLAMADLVADALDLSDAEVTDLVQAVPLVEMLPMERSSNGETHKYTKETGAPTVGFRAPNTGREFSKSADTVVTVTLKVLDFSWAVDKAVADIWRKGGREALIAREGLRHLKAALVKYEKQLIYGTNATHGDTAGFTGMVNASTVDGLADPMVVNAGGTTANTASSVWAIALGPNDVLGVVNGDGEFDLGETTVQNFQDGTGKHYPAYYTPATTWLGLQVGSAHSMGRIVNLTEDSGKGLTDDLIAELLSRFPITHRPTALFMNRRSLKQLQQSRTATNATGAPAPFPSESFGVPITTVESIVNTEALVT